MADQDYPDLYAAMEAAVERVRNAAIAYEATLGGTISQTVPVNGYPAQPTIAKRVDDAIMALYGPVDYTAKRANFFIMGSATKLVKVASTLDWRISFGRLYAFTGAGKGLDFIQGATDLLVPNGMCLYIDMNDVKTGSPLEWVPHVSAISPSSVPNPAGSYIQDGKLILFYTSNDIQGGLLTLPPVIGADAIVETMVSQTLRNRSVRPANLLSFDGFKKYDVSAAGVLKLSFNDIKVSRGVGQASIDIAGVTDLSIPVGQGAYVDLDEWGSAAPTVKLVVKVTTGGYTAVTAATPTGSFRDDNKLMLMVNGLNGQMSGLLRDRHSQNPYIGSVIMKSAAGGTITFDPATRTLTWDTPLVIPYQGFGRRIIIAAGSYVFSNQSLNVAYIDLNDVLSTGGSTSPATVIKGGQYYDAANADAFIATNRQVPIFYYNTVADWGPLGGFPKVGTPVVAGGLDEDDIVVKITPDSGTLGSISAFIKGSKKGSTKYLEQVIAHEQRPFDPTGVDVYGNSDLWRLKGTYETDISAGTTSFTRARSGNPIVNAGEIECAIQEDGAPDYIGGFHGDEILSMFKLFVDGIEVPITAAATLTGKRIQYIQRSTLYRCNTQDPVATHVKRVTIERNEGIPQIRLQQYVKWSAVMVLKSAMLTMLPIKRLLNDSSGPVITDKAMRAPLYEIEDVSTAGFAQIVTLGALPNAQLWGPTGISAEVEMKKYPNNPNIGFFISNASFYNKFYYSVGGTTVSGMGGATHTTAVNETWDVESVIKINTNL